MYKEGHSRGNIDETQPPFDFLLLNGQDKGWQKLYSNSQDRQLR